MEEIKRLEFDLEEQLKPKLDEKGKVKPSLWSKSFKTKKLEKPNKIAVLFLRNNGRAEPMEIESRDGFINILDKTYHENRDCIYQMNLGKDKYPLAIIPEWSLIPVGTKEWEDKEMREKFAELQDHALKGIRNAELVKMGGGRAGNMTPKQIILGLILLVIFGAVGFSYL